MNDEDQGAPEAPAESGKAPRDDVVGYLDGALRAKYEAALEMDTKHDAETADAGQSDDDLTPQQRRALRQQEHRERRIWTGLVFAGLVVLVAFLFAFWPVMAGRLDAAKKLDQAQALLDQAKGTVDSVNRTVTKQLSPEADAGVPDTAAQILVGRRELNQAVALIDSAMPHLTEDEQTRGGLIRAAAEARLAMLHRAPTILVASVKAVASKSLADRGWALTVSATAEETRAVQGYLLQTAPGVENASAAIARIKGSLTDAASLYSQAASAFPNAGFDRYVSYADKRVRAVSLLKQAAASWLSGNRAGAALSFAAYKAARAQADAAGKQLPYAPGAASGEGFRKVAGFAADAYAKAKKQALDADKALADS